MSRRFVRILLPYWIYAAFCLALMCLYALLRQRFDVRLMLRVAWSWVIPRGQIATLPYLTSALWFIPVYLAVMLLFPALARIRRSKFRLVCLPALALLFLATTLTEVSFLRNVAFYTIWTYLGLFYAELRAAAHDARKRRCFFFVAFASVLLAVLLWRLGFSADMQENKFPPNAMFLCYAGGAMGLILGLLPVLDALFVRFSRAGAWRRIAEIYGTRSLTVYLYQTFVFFGLCVAGGRLFPGHGLLADCVRTTVYAVLAVPGCAAAGAIFGRFERVRLPC